MKNIKQNIEKKWVTQVGLSLLMSTVSLVPSFAQASEEEAVTHRGLDEIIITATKSTESLIDVPLAITALGGKDLALRGIDSVEGLATAVPNVRVSQQSGATMITIRGVGLAVDTGYAEPSVAMYNNGIYQPRTTAGLLGAVDLERIEVLRGPQGTLYGRNSTGGVVNFISKRPAEEFEAEIAGGLGNLGTYNAHGIVSGAISDKVRVRVVGAYKKLGDYLDNLTDSPAVGDGTLGQREEYGGSATVEFLPTENLNITIQGHYQEANFAPPQVLLTPPNDTDLAILGAANSVPIEFVVSKTGVYEERDVNIGGIKDWGISTTINWTSDDLDVKLIAGYVDTESDFDIPNDGLNIPFIELVKDDDSESYTTELNVSGEWGAVEWMAGGFYFHENYEAGLAFRFGSFELLPGVPGFYLAGRGIEENENIGIFANTTIHISERLRILGGIRYSRDNKSMTQTNIANAGNEAAGPGDFALDACTFSPVIDTLEFQQSTDNVNPRIAVQYDLNDSANVYAQFQTGFKAGGWNFTGPCGDSFEPEKISAYEVGLKSRIFDGSATLNISGFYYDYTDLQLFTSRTSTAFVVNAPKARIYGLEVEARVQLSEIFTADFTGTLLNARYTDFSDLDIFTGIVSDLEGRSLSRAPDYTLSVGLQADIPLDMEFIGGMRVRVDASYTDDVTYRPYTDADIVSGYFTANGFVEIFDVDEKYQLRAFVKNVTDDRHLTQIFSGGIATGGYRKGTVNLPRTFGAELTARF